MDDLISRKALLDIVGKIPLSWEYGQAISDVYDIIKAMPTLTLDDLRPKGRWVNENGRCGCSECRQGIRSTFEGLEMWLDMSTLPFCSFCGADMRGGGEDA